MKKTYLIIHEGVVKDILKKELPLLPTDVDCSFDHVLVDRSGVYKVGDAFDLADFIAKNEVGFGLSINKFIDMSRYKQ